MRLRHARSTRRFQDTGDRVLTRPLLKWSSCAPPEADAAAPIATAPPALPSPVRIDGAVDQAAEAGSTGPTCVPGHFKLDISANPPNDERMLGIEWPPGPL